MNELFDSLNTHEAEIKSEAFYIILNLYAYAGRCAITWADEIAKKLNFFGIPYELAETKQKGHATQLAEEASEKYKVIVAAGGDGTINEVVNGLLKNSHGKSSDAVLGVIPAGLGNDFAKNLNIRSIDDAIIALQDYYAKKQNTCLIDAGSVEWFENGISQKRYFCNNSGIGFDAHIVAIAIEKEKNREKFDYTALAFKELFKIPAQEAKIKLINQEERKEFKTKIISLNVALGKTTGRMINIAPRASNSDGFFDVCLMKDASSISRLILFPIIISGLHAHMLFLSHWVEYFDPRDRITGVNITEAQLPFQAEGEYFGETPAYYTIMPRAINAIYKRMSLLDRA